MTPNGLQRGGGRARPIYDFDIEHAAPALTIFPVNAVDERNCQERKDPSSHRPNFPNGMRLQQATYLSPPTEDDAPPPAAGQLQ
ncbi:hypothetical protein MES5069_80022 [Mesorhizobium escarrei]|uniref:Uncharacterized protein n=1 Tax=Mesorhizobium escarrei TaxID=666018 RepID=A0ABN8KIA6_9HYPH|nr:hypothetical protein MES5069_80022 [Mesorhizobium escarrei]